MWAPHRIWHQRFLILKLTLTKNVQLFIGVEYTTACDVYSLATCLWEVLSRQRPYKNINPDAVPMAVYLMKCRPSPMPDADENSELNALIVQSWDQQPDNRPTAKVFLLRLLRHSSIVLTQTQSEWEESSCVYYISNASAKIVDMSTHLEWRWPIKSHKMHAK